MNSGYNVDLTQSVNWEPARSNWPALMVDGDLNFAGKTSTVDLSEASASFNPSGTPFRGNSDADAVDSYPNAFAGIFYATGGITFDGGNQVTTTVIEGVVICEGELLIKRKGAPEITYDATYAGDPPPGFGAGDSSSIVGGSWRQTASP